MCAIEPDGPAPATRRRGQGHHQDLLQRRTAYSYYGGCSDDTATCLTTDQGLHRRGRPRRRTHLYTGGVPYGSELKWSGLFIPAEGQGQTSLQMYGIGVGSSWPT